MGRLLHSQNLLCMFGMHFTWYFLLVKYFTLVAGWSPINDPGILHASGNVRNSIMAIIRPMAIQYLYLVTTLLFALTLKQGNSISHQNNHHEPKSLHFTLYFHDMLNKTGHIIMVNGVAGVSITQFASPFGTLYVLQNPMTVSSNYTSATKDVVGIF